MKLSQQALEKRREYHKQWYESNKEKRKEYMREWRKNNKDRLKQYQANYWDKKANENNELEEKLQILDEGITDLEKQLSKLKDLKKELKK